MGQTCPRSVQEKPCLHLKGPTIFGEEQEGRLTVSFDLLWRWGMDDRHLYLKVSGQADASHVTILTRALHDANHHFRMDTIRAFILDLTALSSCHEDCIHVFEGYFKTRNERPNTIVVISNLPWQRRVVQEWPRLPPHSTPYLCTSRPEESVLKELKPQDLPQLSINKCCSHARQKVEEVDFFAPSCNGSILRNTLCVDCGFIVYRTSEYFD
eukprot:scaffold6821_cov159-Ochromonas_danica.AAC.2